jgi:hypothetical protein
LHDVLTEHRSGDGADKGHDEVDARRQADETGKGEGGNGDEGGHRPDDPAVHRTQYIVRSQISLAFRFC